MKKVRIDEFLEANFNIGTVDEIGRLIMAGKVLNNNHPVYKPSEKIRPDKANIRFKNIKPFVSRGGLKLKQAIECFNIEMEKKVMIDIGSSTGGFTDCALQNGAALIYAVDVGTNQLDYKLRIRPDIIVKEQTNFKNTVSTDFNHSPDMVTIDVSFTSIVPILRHINELFDHSFEIVALIKPQFESFLEEREEHGIITSLKTRRDVVERVIKECKNLNFHPEGISRSKVKGTKGNQEYLLYLTHDKNIKNNITEEDIQSIL